MRSLLRTIRQFLSELRRRNVYQVAVAYLAAGFVVVELADIAAGTFDLPGWFGPMVWVAVGLGFPIALVLAWALEVTPDGVRGEESVVGETYESEEVPPATNTTRHLWVGASVLMLLLVGTWWMWSETAQDRSTKPRQSQISGGEEHSIAVLPFEVSGAGAEDWRDGMVTILSMNLDGAGQLRAVADRTVLAAWQEHELADQDVSTQEALEVARGIGPRYAVLGSAVQIGETLRLGAEVRAVTSGERLGRVDVKGTPHRVTALTDQLTRKVLGVILENSEDQIPSVNLASITTPSLGPLKAYLRGERHFRAGEYTEAARDFQFAVSQDSTFALAYARLYHTGSWLEQDHSARALQRAYENSGRLPERERRILEARYFWELEDRPVAAANQLRRLTRDYPDDPSVWYELGEVIYHGVVPPGLPTAETAYQKAVQLDPGLAPYHHHLAQLTLVLRDDLELASNRIESHPDGRYKQAFRLAFNLVADSAKTRPATLKQVNTLPAVDALMLVVTLWSPEHEALQKKVIRQILERDDIESGRYATLLVSNSLESGQIENATAQLETRQLAVGPRGEISPRCLLALEISLGTPIPDSAVRPRLEPSRLEHGASLDQLMCSGIYLVQEGRGKELPPLFDRLRTAGTERGLSKTEIQRRIDEVRGYRAWKNEDLGQAETHWAGHNESLYWGALHRGDLFRKLDQLERAEGWYLAAWKHPVAHERLGQLYEQMGKSGKAAAAYERFIEAWKNADRALQDRVEAARRRLARLEGTAAASPTDRPNAP